ncbi:MAG: extracellular solute-binding protein [Defluviitaleaceae bacterium]|nr:extracellular solute-binding protein [Defluviitaleaceae bacterium]
MKKLYFLAILAIFVISACTNDPDVGGTAIVPVPTETPVATGDSAAEPATEIPEMTEEERLIAEHFPGTDLGGVTVRISTGSGIYSPEDENPVNAALAVARRDYVEEKFNITLELVELSGIDWNAVPNHITASLAAGDPMLHIFGAANAGSWLPPMANQGILVEGGQWIVENFPPSWWQYHSEHLGRIYGFMTTADYAWDILAFNTQLVLQAGMDRTPQEMFMAGEWHLDDFYAYLSLLNSLLPPDIITIGMSATNWQRGAAFANGGYFKHPRTHVPGYLNEAFLQPARTLQQLIASGIHMQPVFLPEEESAISGGIWSFGAEMGSPIGEFLDGNMAMVLANTWHFGEIAANFEFGIVPFPWGDNVTFPASGDWRDLRIENPAYNSFSNDASTNLLIQGAPAGLNHEVMTNIIFSLLPDRGLNLIEERERHAQGLPEIATPGGMHDLWSDLDREIFRWYASNPLWEPLMLVGTPQAFHTIWQNAMATGADLRTAFSAVIGEDVWTMYIAGTILLEDVPESVRLQAEEFDAGRVWR